MQETWTLLLNLFVVGFLVFLNGFFVAAEFAIVKIRDTQLQPLIDKWYIASTWLGKQVWSITSVSIAAQLATCPIGILYFHQFPNCFLFSNLLIIPLTTPKPAYSVGDFRAIYRLISTALVFAVHPSVPAADLQGLIAHARINPGKLTYGTPGIGTGNHLAGELLRQGGDQGFHRVHDVLVLDERHLDIELAEFGLAVGA